MRRPAKVIEFADFLWIGAGIGVCFGLAEALIVVSRQTLLSDPMFDYTSHVAWTAPLLSGAAFLLVAGTLYWVTAVLPGPIRAKLVGFAVGALVGYGLTGALALGIARWARLLLAVGLGMRLAVAWSESREGLRRWMRRAALFGTLWVAGVAGYSLLGVPLREALGPADQGDRPNVLVLLLDTVRAQSLGLYGHHRDTSPNLDRLAQRGTWFRRAFAPSGYTHPSHASLFTGRTPSELGIDQWTPLPNDPPTLAEVLSAEGYATAAFMANVYFGRTYFGLNRGFTRYEHFPLRFGVLVADSWLMGILARRWESVAGPLVDHKHKRASDIRTSFLRWLDRRNDRPFFAFLNFMDAHTPRRPPAPYYGMFSDVEAPYEGTAPNARESRLLRESEDNYDGSIRYLDEQIGELLAELEARGQLDNTLIVLTADHGEQFGEHGYVDHGNSLYAQLTWVPLILSFPGRVPADRSVSRSATLMDVGATVLDYLGVEGEPQLGGRSLRSLVEAAEAGDAWAELPADNAGTEARFLISEGTDGPREHLISLVRDSLHFIQSRDGSVELFNIVTDPEERIDLWDDEAAVRPAWRSFLKRAQSHASQ